MEWNLSARLAGIVGGWFGLWPVGWIRSWTTWWVWSAVAYILGTPLLLAWDFFRVECLGSNR